MMVNVKISSPFNLWDLFSLLAAALTFGMNTDGATDMYSHYYMDCSSKYQPNVNKADCLVSAV